MHLQIIFVAVYLLAGHADHGIQPDVECADATCLPCERPVSRTLSALPLAGFVSHPEDLMSCQWVTRVPRHAHFHNSATDTVVARSNSAECDLRKTPLFDEEASAGSQTGVLRAQSLPMSPRSAEAFKAKPWDIEFAVPSPRAMDPISTTPMTDSPTHSAQDQLLALHQVLTPGQRFVGNPALNLHADVCTVNLVTS